MTMVEMIEQSRLAVDEQIHVLGRPASRRCDSSRLKESLGRCAGRKTAGDWLAPKRGEHGLLAGA